jgi:transposase-like protein
LGHTIRPSYPEEFRAEAVRLARTSGKSVTAIAADLSISPQSLRNWMHQADIDEGRRGGLTTEERAELRSLRRKVRLLEEEREILKKAAAFFAAEEKNRSR